MKRYADAKVPAAQPKPRKILTFRCLRKTAMRRTPFSIITSATPTSSYAYGKCFMIADPYLRDKNGKNSKLHGEKLTRNTNMTFVEDVFTITCGCAVEVEGVSFSSRKKDTIAREPSNLPDIFGRLSRMTNSKAKSPGRVGMKQKEGRKKE